MKEWPPDEEEDEGKGAGRVWAAKDKEQSRWRSPRRATRAGKEKYSVWPPPSQQAWTGAAKHGRAGSKAGEPSMGEHGKAWQVNPAEEVQRASKKDARGWALAKDLLGESDPGGTAAKGTLEMRKQRREDGKEVHNSELKGMKDGPKAKGSGKHQSLTPIQVNKRGRQPWTQTKSRWASEITK